jgi:hypothetical protein
MLAFLRMFILKSPVKKAGIPQGKGVMLIWTWIFDTIHCALCHHNSSHMLNEMFLLKIREFV